MLIQSDNIENSPFWLRYSWERVWLKRHQTGAWLIGEYNEDSDYGYIYWSKQRRARTGNNYSRHITNVYSLEEFYKEIEHAWFMGNPPNYCKPTKSRRTRDVQRQKVYNWESKIVTKIIMTKEEMISLTNKIHEDHGKKLPKISFNKRGGGSCWPGLNKIAYGCSSNMVVIHECAHNLHGVKTKEASHGPEYVKIYLYLLDKYTDQSFDELKETLGNVKISDKPVEELMKGI